MNSAAIKSSKLNAMIKTARPTPRPTNRIQNGNRVAVQFRGRWELYTVDGGGLEMFVRFCDSFDAFAWVYA
jgi:hypothetical protein